MTVSPPTLAQLRLMFSVGRPLLVTFTDGERVRLRDFWHVDASINGKQNQWSATIDEVLTGDSERQRLFRPGSGMDFLGIEVGYVLDESTGTQLFPVAASPNKSLERTRDG